MSGIVYIMTHLCAEIAHINSLGVKNSTMISTLSLTFVHVNFDLWVIIGM